MMMRQNINLYILHYYLKNPEDNCTSKSKANSKLETNGKSEIFVSSYKIKCQFTYSYT